MSSLCNEINFASKIEIGGIKQYIQIRGTDNENPILLYLHGGPGIPTSSTSNIFQKQLEKQFIVVNWDQRGAGKSYLKDIPIDSMNLKQLVNDTIEVIDYLLKMYKKQKLYLFGQSFGSVVGLMVAKRYPEKIYAYISTGQLIDTNENEKVSYNKAYEEATLLNNTKALAELDMIGFPPYKELLEGVSVLRKWLSFFGYIERKSTFYQTLKDNVTENELKNIIAGSQFSVRYLFVDLFKTEVNFFKSIKELNIPIYFCLGKYDYATPSEIAASYLNQLNAKEKEIIWFNESGHFPEYEETEKFVEVLSQIKKRCLI